MSIVKIQMDFPCQTFLFPRIGRMHSTDSLATVQTAGYINQYIHANAISVFPNDLMAVYIDTTTSQVSTLCTVSITGGVVTLTSF